jgi:hypothetical protein
VTTNFHRSPDERLLDAIVEAAGLVLDEIEYRIALDTIGLVAYDYDDDALIPTDWLVSEIEKNVGLGLDEAQFAQAVVAVKALLQPVAQTLPAPAPLSLAPDAHLEMAYEDRLAVAD